MRWKFLSVLGLVVCAIAPARGELGDDYETVASVDAYEKCATIMAQHYATGPDVADLITKAATEACLPQLRAVAQSLQRKGESQTSMMSAIYQINTQLRRKLKMLILDERAKK
jgi:hypothetical protein